MSASGLLIHISTFVAIFALLALGLNIKFGYAGLLDFGHVAFFLVGAYVTALFVLPPPEEYPIQTFAFGLNMPWSVGLLAGTLAAALLGLLVALPAIRLRADYLAIALLGVSVILVRVVQTEGWLANGPDSLRGFDQPLRHLFPLPGEGLTAAIVFGGIVFVVWSVLLFFVAKLSILDARSTLGERSLQGLLAAVTLGVGYVAAARSRRSRTDSGLERGHLALARPRDYWPLFSAAFALGTAGAVGSIAGYHTWTLFGLLGTASIATWVVAGLEAREHYEEYTAREWLVGLAIALAFLATLVPARQFGEGHGDAVTATATVLTLGLIAALLSGLYLGYRRWETLPLEGSFLGVVGIATVWLLAIRYFVVSLPGSSLSGMRSTTVQNLLWLVNFGPVSYDLDYSRFFLVAVVATVAVVYVLMEATARSPFGRVLKSIREDEDVALALGKNTFSYKVQSMILGSAVAGLAGGYYAIFLRSLNYEMFQPIITFIVFLMVILGGKANNKGVILGAAMYWIFVRFTIEFADMFPPGVADRITILRNAIIGLLLIGILYYRPSGLWGEERFLSEVEGE
ncbi:ABC transporter permease subunit [Halopiger goleimassiliensis]|uniref:ABC transporter permease subunit n=1 Tax=Halopiger goleimassiliensis TaxID=1293048 RepID=UPI000677ED3D|nr:hypothetical protein [Halopiger goleimassiliensis]